jgi:hypothetical protein
MNWIIIISSFLVAVVSIVVVYFIFFAKDNKSTINDTTLNTTTLNTTTPIQIGISVRNSVINTVEKSEVKTKELVQENNA